MSMGLLIMERKVGNMKRYFPLFIDISKKDILVVGAGKIAYRRIKTLLEFGAHIILVSKEIDDEVKELLKDDPKTVVFEREFYHEDILGKDIIFACTNDEKLNYKITRYANAKNIPVNNASDKNFSDFYFPAIILEDEITIALSSNGDNIKGTKSWRIKIEEFLKNMRNKE